MRNQRGTYSAGSTKAAKSAPKPFHRALAQKKSSSCQTERVVLIKEENLTFYPCTRLGQNDGGMRRDYTKAVNYINSCHKFINTIIEKNRGDSKNNVFLLPMVTNFIPIFPHLLGKKRQREEVRKSENQISSKSEERKSKSSFGVKKVPEKEMPVDPTPVGDCGKTGPQISDEKYALQVADIVKEQIQLFLTSLHQDLDKSIKRPKSGIPRPCKNLEIVKQHLEQLSKCCQQKQSEETPQEPVTPEVPLPPPTPPALSSSGECSVIQSDTDEEKPTPEPGLRITCYDQSASSLNSESSDIKSDSDLEINA